MTDELELAPHPPLVARCDEDGVVTLTLNRGDRFNPLSAGMIAALDAELDRVAADPAARVIVLRGQVAASAPGTTSRRCELTATTLAPSRSSRRSSATTRS